MPDNAAHSARPPHRHRPRLYAGRDDPVEQDRLLQPDVEVVVRSDPVAAGQHFAAGFGVVGLVRVLNGRSTQSERERDEAQEQQCGSAPHGRLVYACRSTRPKDLADGLSGRAEPASRWTDVQCRKCRRPVKTIANPVLVGGGDDLGITLPDPPGWMTAVAPAAATASSPSRNGKYASDAATEPARRSAAFQHGGLHRVHATHLPGADRDRHIGPGEDDRVRLDVRARRATRTEAPAIRRPSAPAA